MEPQILKNGTNMPMLGFGTYQITGDDAYNAVTTALQTGYRHIDTALRYGNHHEVGQAIADSGIAREELFVTSKIFFEHFPADQVRTAVEQALSELQMEYLDLVLMHWPDRTQDMQATLEALRACQEAGLVKEIGVSNFTINHLKDALSYDVPFSINQVEYHPSLNQQELLDFCREHGITVTAYSPIAQGEDLSLPLVTELAEKYERSASQIIINWLLHKNIVTIPRSTNPEHIEDNFHAQDFTMDAPDYDRLNEINTDHRVITPSFADFDY